MQSNLVETLIGTVVVAVAAVFLFYGYTSSGMRSATGYNVEAAFSSVDGLATGADVRLSGIKIGTVVKQSLDPETYQAIVTLDIAPHVKLPEDSSAKITSEGLLGGSYISVTPGGSEELLTDGSEIMFTQGSIDLMSLIGQAVFSASDGGDSK
ncbi:outer membrane lipid asymmetry maintenance protein MlaD [Parvibaculum sp.]|jgi:phospholipid/cholesterol/gamma-HCH transport system substrate-binding protein|uniref:outer membrane lipid asymmetry maintenance protein MlaD n=1 Tax=Parvibaculum sp. TaxID=2024848 RepID=UPI000C4EE638|nr:outer membrane lipid asymmetry maintenance protein MlaD [Parvibaculum sp.]MAM96161.1 outer membrane lipid asymmetry maintenance protein MlaD [Parvibaculum sp.]HCX66086.1 outer membrane lipid asymmetry maintenance protein MlaD [Rhodobiaceae bacterium]|tara:strand:+ start:34721 stop:35179 length:459 start_codon:yes stop_codon:yes gene_type:complete